MIEEAAKINRDTDGTEVLTDKWGLLKRLFERPGPLVLDVSLEAFIFEIEDFYAHNATGAGGLGFLAGEMFGAYPKDSELRFAGFIPLYQNFKDPHGDWHRIDWDNEEAVTPVLYKGQPLKINVDFFDNSIRKQRPYEFQVYLINRDGTPVFGARCTEMINVLYPDEEQIKMRQFGFFGKVVIETFKKINEIYGDKGKVAILRLNEPQLAIVEVARQNDIKNTPHGKSPWKDTKLFVTIHTPNSSAFPRPSVEELKSWIGDELVPSTHDIFDFGQYLASRSRANKINAVSEENALVAKRRVFPQRDDIKGIQNGSDPKIWKSKELLELERKIGKENVTGENLDNIVGGNKNEFNEYIYREFGFRFDDINRLTIGLVRRIVTYKEQGILIAMIEWICGNTGEEYDTPWYGIGERRKGMGMNLFIGGVGRDDEGRRWVRIFKDIQNRGHLNGKFIFIESTGASLMKKATQGVDLWTSMPWITEEASGTSGGRTSLNGVLNIAAMTGEGLVLIKEGKTGWPINPFKGELKEEVIDAIAKRDPIWIERFKVGAQRDIADALIEAREFYYNNREEWRRRMKNTYDTANQEVDINVMVAKYIIEFKELLDDGMRISETLNRTVADTSL